MNYSQKLIHTSRVLKITMLTLSVFLVIIMSEFNFMNFANAASPTNGLVGYWKMDDSGGTITDYSGNGYNGTFTGATSVSGKIGNALDFGGVSTSYGEVVRAGKALLDPQEVTLSAWLKPVKDNNYGKGAVGRFVGSAGPYTYGLQWLDGSANDSIYAVITTNTATTKLKYDIPAHSSTWSHWAVTYSQSNGGEVKLFKDGIEVATQSGIGTSLKYRTQTGDNFFFGKDYTGYYKGSIDDVRVYGRALSSQEVRDIYNDQTNSTTVPPINTPPTNIPTSTTTVTTDIIPPVISLVNSTGVTNSTATVTWTTDEVSNGQIEYGLTTSYGSTSLLDTNFVTSHSISLSSLTAGTLYHYRVRSRDASGNLAVSPDKTFTTTGNTILPPVTGTPATVNSPQGNGITIKEKTGQTQTNYPVQTMRLFVKGDIRNFPQAVIAGIGAVPTQADVKTRHSDGSVSSAIVSFIVPSLPANQSIGITFQNQTNSNNTPLSQSEMLDPKYDFDAITQISDGINTYSASARQMLQDGKYTIWTSGPIATTLILADHSVNRKYDMGFDSYKSFRPIYHATFWPGINKVKVRFIGEVGNTEAFQDVVLSSLVLKTGNTSPLQVYSKNNFTMYAGSRWTKEFWINSAPTAISQNPNIKYLIDTKYVMNHDLTKTVPEATLASEYSLWLSKPRDIYDAGLWFMRMLDVSGRREIGEFPAWTIRWLYTGDDRMEEEMLGSADLAASWPVHFREGDPTRFYDVNKNISSIGKPVNLNSRPTIVTGDGNQYLNKTTAGMKAIDFFKVVGPVTNGGWVPDSAHHSDAFSIPYLLTGDYFYLEELEFSANWTSFNADIKNRGPVPSTGGIREQVRGEAWTLRNRVRTAFLLPDGTPNKNHFEKLMQDVIAIWEGERNIKGTSYENTPNWIWGNTVGMNQKWPVIGPPPMGFWDKLDNRALKPQYLDISIASDDLGPFMQYFMILTLNYAKEMGYKTDALHAWASRVLISEITDPLYDPYLSVVYDMPIAKICGTGCKAWFSDWGELKTAFWPTTLNNSSYELTSRITDTEHGYPYIAMAAASTLTQLPGGQQTYDWFYSKIGNHLNLNRNPKWAILPRNSGTTVPPVVDVTAPVITSLTTSNLSNSSATVTWNTDELANSQVEYGTSPSYGLISQVNSSMALSHNISLSGLNSGTQYFFRARSRDAAGNIGVSAQQTFTTTGTATTTNSTKKPRKFRMQSSSLEGTLSLTSYPSLTIQVINPINKVLVSTNVLTADVNGEYTLNFQASDPTIVDLRLKVGGYLAKVLRSIDTTVDPGTTSTIPTLQAGDLNNDGIINSVDYSLLSRKWNQTTNVTNLDINKDGVVNSLDYAILSKNWGNRGE